MFRFLPATVATAILLASGYVQGLWTGRWSASDELLARASRLASVPRMIGDWEGRDQGLDPRTLEHAGIVGGLLREYANRRNGDRLTVLLVCGRPGPIAVHTPEVCYAGAGYDEDGSRVRVAITSGPASTAEEFWATEFDKRDAALPTRLRILYAWNGDGSWKAAESSRYEFAGCPLLYKLYVVRTVSGDAAREGTDPGAEFLAAMLPEIRGALFPNPSVGPGHPVR